MYFVRELDPKEKMMLRVGGMKKSFAQAIKLATRLAKDHRTYTEVYEDNPSNLVYVAVKDTTINLAALCA